jgi:hypothetical protein
MIALSLTAMVRVGNLGGLIRHPEIERPSGSAEDHHED